jgi:beta-lactamase class A
MLQAIETLIQQCTDATVAVAFHDEATGTELLIRPDERFHPASTIKIAIMMKVFNQAHQGILALDQHLPIINDFVSIADGSHFSVYKDDDTEFTLYQRLGQTESLRELIRLMITTSSNFATNLLIQRVTATRVTALMRALGVQDIVVLRGPEDNQAYARGMNNVATAHGLMRLLRRLAAGRVVSPRASKDLIQVRLGQTYNEGIPSGVPPGVPVAHKPGWNPQLYHDAAIVLPEGRKPYILVVMTQGIENEKDAHSLVAAISRQCYETITR